MDLLALVVVYAVVFAGLTAWLATHKNRTALEGAVIGASLGLVGFAFLGLAPAPKERHGLSPLSMALLAVILVLLLWAAAGLPGL